MKLYPFSINCFSPASEVALSYKKKVIICFLASTSSFVGKDLKKVDKYYGKNKVGVRKMVNLFEEFCGASFCISEVIKDKKWKSVWLLLEPEKHSVYRIRVFYCKSIKSGATNPVVNVETNDNNCDDNAAIISIGGSFEFAMTFNNSKKEAADILHS